MKIGISALVYEIDKAIEICKNTNEINHIEIGIDNIKQCSDVLKYKDEFKNLDISISLHLPMELNPCEDVDYIRDRWREYINILQNSLSELNIKYMNMHLGYVMSSRLFKNREKYLKNCVEFLDKLESQIPITIENTYSNKGDFSNVGNNAGDFEYIFNNTNNNKVYFCYDTGHNLINSSNYLQILKDKIKVVHLSDNDGINDSHMGIGKGILKIDELKEINNIEVEYLILEIIYKDIQSTINNIKVFI